MYGYKLIDVIMTLLCSWFSNTSYDKKFFCRKSSLFCWFYIEGMHFNDLSCKKTFWTKTSLKSRKKKNVAQKLEKDNIWPSFKHLYNCKPFFNGLYFCKVLWCSQSREWVLLNNDYLLVMLQEILANPKTSKSGNKTIVKSNYH